MIDDSWYSIQGSDIGIPIIRANQSSDINVNELSMNIYIYIILRCDAPNARNLELRDGWNPIHLFFFGWFKVILDSSHES